jgi:hypothetical protein
MDIEEANSNSNVNGTLPVEGSMKVAAMVYHEDIEEDINEQLI